MHFMNPVPLMKLVEIVRGLPTSDATAETVTTLAQRLGKTVVGARCVVPQDESIDQEVLLDRGDGASHPGIIERQKAYGRNQQETRVELRRSVGLNEAAEAGVEAARADLIVNRLAQRAPSGQRPGESGGFHRPDAPVQCDPGHHLGVDEVAGASPDLPDTFVGALPHRGEVGEERTLERPVCVLRINPASPCLMQRIHHFAKYIELELPVIAYGWVTLGSDRAKFW